MERANASTTPFFERGLFRSRRALDGSNLNSEKGKQKSSVIKKIKKVNKILFIYFPSSFEAFYQKKILEKCKKWRI